MILDQKEPQDIEARLAANRFCLEIGPFRVRLGSRIPAFAEHLRLMYAQAQVLEDPTQELVDFHIELLAGRGLRRWWRPQIYFKTDSSSPFAPFPREQAFALFEWGLNWCVAMQAHQYLMLHSAVLERGGKALLLPALPGSGKSTLCAALMLRGWRLLSDEFGLYRPETGMMQAIPRPIPLKNQSIEVIKAFSPDAVMGPVFANTRKGDVAHLRPSKESMLSVSKPAKPAWVVFPRYRSGIEELLHPFAKGRSFLQISGNSFNYRLQGARGFSATADIVDSCNFQYLEFSNLEKAVNLLEELADSETHLSNGRLA